jgi:hypothetical protein
MSDLLKRLREEAIHCDCGHDGDCLHFQAVSAIEKADKMAQILERHRTNRIRNGLIPSVIEHENDAVLTPTAPPRRGMEHERGCEGA